MKPGLKNLISDETGTSAIEYALIGMLIATVIFVSVHVVSTQLLSLFNYVKDQVILASQ